MTTISVIVVLAISIAILVARFFKAKQEVAITGGLYLMVEAYKFYLQEALNLPLLPTWFVLFVGVYVITSAFLLVFRFVPVVGPYIRILTD